MADNECCARVLNTLRPTRGAMHVCQSCSATWTYVHTGQWRAWMRWGDVLQRPEILNMSREEISGHGNTIALVLAVVLAIVAAVVGCGCGNVTANERTAINGNDAGPDTREVVGERDDVENGTDADSDTSFPSVDSNSADDVGNVEDRAGNSDSGIDAACAPRGPVCYACKRIVACATAGRFACCANDGETVGCDLTWCHQ